MKHITNELEWIFESIKSFATLYLFLNFQVQVVYASSNIVVRNINNMLECWRSPISHYDAQATFRIKVL